MRDTFAITTEKYQGPLETLLDLIEARKMPISEISLAEVCDHYLAYIEQLPALPLPETSQFVLVASTLLLIKSRSLLPTLDLTVEEKESVDELERRLARLALFRKASRLLRKSWGTAPLYLARRTPERPIIFAPAESSFERIQIAIRMLLQTLPKPQKLVEAAVAPVVALEDVIANLKVRLSKAINTRWSELTRGASKHDSIVHFLAILELIRGGHASAIQHDLFADISIEPEMTSDLPRYGF